VLLLHGAVVLAVNVVVIGGLMERTSLHACFAIGAVFVTLGVSASGQQPIFRAGTEVVQLDVSVLDKQGRPVHGLTQEDFVVLEDGTPQRVVAFKSVDLDSAAPTALSGAPTWAMSVQSDVSTNRFDSHRLFVIVMDDATIVTEAVDRAQDAARSVIDKLGSSDLATVIFTRRGNFNGQAFTSDHAKLRDAIGTFSTDDRSSSRPDCASQRDALDAVRRATDSLVAESGQRKTLVYISSSMEVDLGKADECGVNHLAEEVFRTAERANLNIYPIDACGLRTATTVDPPPPACGEPLPSAGKNPNEHADFLRTIADNTGGQAIVMTNDFEPGIVQMFKASGSYYLVGYAPSKGGTDGASRRIEVKVPGRRDVDVWTRKNYYEPDLKADAKSAAVSPDNLKVLEGILPSSDVSLQMAAAPFRRGDKTSAVAVVLGVTRDDAASRGTDALSVVVSAFTRDGKLAGMSTLATRVAGVVPSDGMLRYEVLASIGLPPGRYELRAGLHSSELDKDGSVYGDVEIPDYSKAALSLSGVALNVTPGLVAEPRAAYASVLPVVPTSQRVFHRGDHVRAFVQIYEGGGNALAPATLQTWIRDVDGKRVVDQTQTIAAADFNLTARSVDHLYDLPVTGLAAGEYVLTFRVVNGRDGDWRDVRFTVK